MNSFIFGDWLFKWNMKLKQENRKILLILENAIGHAHLDIANIELLFLPKNTTSIFQPLDMGVIKSLENYYSNNLLKNIFL